MGKEKRQKKKLSYLNLAQDGPAPFMLSFWRCSCFHLHTLCDMTIFRGAAGLLLHHAGVDLYGAGERSVAAVEMESSRGFTWCFPMVSQNGGTPKSYILVGLSILKQPFSGDLA